MEFRFEDILKKIIPGFIFLTGVVIICFNQLNNKEIFDLISSDLKEYSEVILFLILIISYLFGYLNDSISSLLENYILYNLINKPSYHILKKSCRKKHIIHDLTTIISKVEEKYKFIIIELKKEKIDDLNKAVEESTEIFKLINQNKKNDESIKEYYFSYIFSRNIFFSYAFLLISIIVSNHFDLGRISYTILLLILVVFYNRRIENSYYYSRKVLLSILNK
jgi:hypothetical protein